ncbi:MAG: hypothetical protein LUQ31_02160 [Methanoregula sp.]|nr:hypothetical protein [Methanoregula sp.]
MGLMEILWPLFFPVPAAVITIIHIRAKHYSGVASLETFFCGSLLSDWA